MIGRCIRSMMAMTLLGLCLMAVPAYAEEPTDLAIEISEEATSGWPILERVTSPDFGVVPYGDYLSVGGCGINKMSNTIVQVDGYTSCSEICDEVYLGLFLDRQEDDGSWQTIYIKELSEENCFGLTYHQNVLVKAGYWYRIRGGHIARKNGVMESNTSISPSLFFGSNPPSNP